MEFAPSLTSHPRLAIVVPRAPALRGMAAKQDGGIGVQSCGSYYVVCIVCSVGEPFGTGDDYMAQRSARHTAGDARSRREEHEDIVYGD